MNTLRINMRHNRPPVSLLCASPSYSLQPLLDSGHWLHQLLCCVLLHWHPSPVPRWLCLDPGQVALPASRHRLPCQRADDQRGNRPVQDEGHGSEGLQGWLGIHGDFHSLHCNSHRTEYFIKTAQLNHFIQNTAGGMFSTGFRGWNVTSSQCSFSHVEYFVYWDSWTCYMLNKHISYHKLCVY